MTLISGPSAALLDELFASVVWSLAVLVVVAAVDGINAEETAVLALP